MADAQLPKSLIVSFVFLAIAVVGYLPLHHFSDNPVDGFEGWGVGIGVAFIFFFVSVPASFLSLVFGLAAIRKSFWALITVVPTSLFLGYLALKMIRINAGS